MICDTFSLLASKTWNNLQKSRRLNFQLKEETITDNNLLYLKGEYPKQILTYVFSKPYEAKNGADWEWWFHRKNYWLGFRVQAKILNFTSEKFEQLHFKNKSGIYQADLLIQNALKKPFQKIPLYCLYIQSDLALLKHWNCLSISPKQELYGCSLVSAFDVKRLRSTNKSHLKDLASLLHLGIASFVVLVMGVVLSSNKCRISQ